MSASLSLLRDRIRIAATFVRLEIIDTLSYPFAVVMTQLSAILPVFVFYFVSQLFEMTGRGTVASVGGDYFTFTVIGLAVMTLLQGALGGFTNVLSYAIDKGNLETYLVEPVPWRFIPIAMSLWSIILRSVVALIILLVGALLGAEYRLAGVPAFLAVVVLGLLATSAVGILSASLLVLAKRSSAVITLYGLVASIFAGTLFPVELIPAWLRWVSYLLPHTYVIDVGRQLLMASQPTAVVSASGAVMVLMLFCVVAFPVGLRLFSRSLQYSRRMGLLSGY